VLALHTQPPPSGNCWRQLTAPERMQMRGSGVARTTRMWRKVTPLHPPPPPCICMAEKDQQKEACSLTGAPHPKAYQTSLRYTRHAAADRV